MSKPKAIKLHSTLFTQILHGRSGVVLVEPGKGILLWVGEGETLHGYGVYVKKQERNSGLGSKLLEAGFESGRVQGFKQVIVSPYHGSQAIEWLGRHKFEPKQVVMVREL
jgi:GNAT superfamily N-acetyltransferase